MKCPKCGYHSFDHLDICKKCNKDLVEHKTKFNLRGFFSSAAVAAAVPEPIIDESDNDLDQATDSSVDLGFDFLEEEDQPGASTEETPLDSNNQDINIDQPFGVDSETLPADSLDFDLNDDDNDKPDKGPEFAF